MTGSSRPGRPVVLAGGRRLPRRSTSSAADLDRRTDGLSRATLTTGLALFGGAVLAWLLVSGLLARRWPWEQYGEQSSRADVLKLALGVVAAGGAAVALVVNYRRQQHLERDEAGRRDQVRLFTERFGAAAAQLGGERPAVRLAGVYALAALADEWDTQRQQCIDVLCGYLRLPYGGEPAPGHPQLVVEQRQYAGGAVQRTETTTYQSGENQVRAAIVATIRRHLQPSAATSWSQLDFDFSGATLIDASFDQAVFAGGRVSFDGTSFVGRRTSFIETSFSGRSTSFEEATFAGGNTWFVGAAFTAERTSFDRAVFAAERTWFDGAVCAGELTSFAEATFRGGRTSFEGVAFSGLRTSFERAAFSGEHAAFNGAVFTADDTWFTGATFSGETTAFVDVDFAGPGARFDLAAFSAELTGFVGAVFRGPATSFDAAVFGGQITSFRSATFANVDAALGQAEVGARTVEWGPVPPRCPWPRNHEGP